MDLRSRLACPTGDIDAVLDTDTYNEIDDQFALSYMMALTPRVALKAIYAAPFLNDKSQSPEDGMEKSYAEIHHILALAGREDLSGVTFKGSRTYLQDEKTPVPSDAAADLCARAMAYSPDKPLYVVAVGAITNVASALLLNPEIVDRIVVVWLGGHALHWPNTREFNMRQDIAAARVVLGCGAAVALLPCSGVVDHFTVSGSDLKDWLAGKNKLADYLTLHTTREAESYAAGKPWSRVIWDVTAICWLVNDGDRFLRCRVIPAPIPGYDHQYTFDPARHPICYVWHINRDAIAEDLFSKLAGFR